MVRKTQVSMKKTLYPLALLCLFLTLPHFSSAQQWFKDAHLQDAQRLGGSRQVQPDEARIISVDLEALISVLSEAPMWHTPEAAEGAVHLQLPLPNGHNRSFKVVEAPVMAEGLSARYPGMRSFAAYSPEDGTAYARFGYTHKGFHAMILSGLHSTVFIDVFSDGQTRYHQVYYKSDYSGIPGNAFSCRLHADAATDATGNSDTPPAALLGDCLLRNYRLAIACTGEYAQFHGGTVPDVLAAYNVAMTRVNGVYERDFTVHMELVDETDQVIFLDGATDPFTNNSAGTLLSENQDVVDNLVGFDNYDVGHVFSTSGGGVASLASICTNRKARGVTGLPSPINDPFYIDYVAHEFGHQFGANHTQNNNCNRVAAAAMEPGSASTIMGYAGICSPNVQNNSDDHFHAISIQEVTNTIEFGAGSTCPELIDVGNSGPILTDEEEALFLPVSTPFFLRAEATDAEGDALTYCWEQMDNEIATMPPVAASTGGPAFRSLSPTPDPVRYFPNLNAVVSNTPDTWEVLPSVSRTMSFRCSVRDNFPGGGCVKATDVELVFSDDAGPFVVQQPNTSVVWEVGTLETVTWDVAGTDGAPVNCSAVDIYLSKDGGFTYPVLLAQGVPNDGEQEILVPLEVTTAARIQVVASDNVFFDISDEDFEIQLPPSPTVLMASTPSAQALCNDTSAAFEILTTPVAGFSEMLDLSVTGLPDGATATFSVNPVGAAASSVLTIGDLEGAASGVYELSLEATSPSVSKSITLILDIAAGVPEAAVPATPAPGTQSVPLNPTLSWSASDFADHYRLEVATSPAFGVSTIIEEVVPDTTLGLVGLEEFTVYYWRATPVNECGATPGAAWSSFQTLGNNCTVYTDAEPGLVIPPSGTGDFTTTLTTDGDFTIQDLNVGLAIDHTWLGDLSATLSYEGGPTVTLFDQPGVPGSDFGCSQDDMLVGFDDDAPLTAEEFENSCEASGPYAISGNFQPLDPLSAFTGLSASGTWTLTISDAFNQDGGNLVSWSIEACPPSDVPNPAEVLANQTLEVPYAQQEVITADFLAFEKGALAPEDIFYTLTALPEHGVLQRNGSGVLSMGDVFSQADINNGLLSYQHGGNAATADQFVFDLTDAEGGWRPGETFELLILEPAVLSALASVTNPLRCAGDTDGTIEVAVAGGLPPYVFTLNGGTPQDSPLFDGLAAGVYTIVISDDSGQELTLPAVELQEPDPLELSAGLSVNTLVLEAVGGTEPYQYSLDGGVAFSPESAFEGLPNAVYSIVVEDANGCQTSLGLEVNLIQSAGFSVMDNSCAGTADGSITATGIQGGVAPYSYSLNGGDAQLSPEFAALPAGNYDLLITDANGSVLELENIEVGAPAPLQLSTGLTGNDLTLSADGGTPPYQYSIDGGATFGAVSGFNDLPNGLYELEVLDANNCSATGSLAINLIVSAGFSITDASCSNTADGSLTVVSVEGGEAPYTYQLGTGAVQDTPVFENLSAGNYTLTIADANGNLLQTSGLLVGAPAPLTLSAETTLSDLALSAEGGTPPYTYSIDGGTTFGNDFTFAGLPNGVYALVVQDANGCTVAGQATINIITSAAVLAMEVSCAGAADGRIEVDEVAGGLPPYTYSLNGNDPQSSSVFENLPGGTYTVAITDANGSTFLVTDIVVGAPPVLELAADVDDNTLTLQASGGTPPYAFSIDGGSNFQPSGVFSGLDNGDYTALVVDVNGCTVSISANVNIVVDASIEVQNVSCAGDGDGAIEVQNVTGGVAPYTYQLNEGGFGSNPVFSDLGPGVYNLEIQDSEGFIYSTAIEITSPAPLEAAVEVVEDAITITASGGTPPFVYSIDGGENFDSPSSITGLPNGVYEVIVMDSNGCQSGLQSVTVMVSSAGGFPADWAVRLSPNPTTGPLMMEGNGFDVPELQWSLVSPLGQVLQSGRVPVTHQQWQLPLPLEQLPSGIYWVELRTATARGAWPVIKQ
jgi:subtilisin-like proprotein convertase family protein